MSSLFKRLNTENLREIKRLQTLIKDLKTLNWLGNNQNKWRNLTSENRHRLHNLNMRRKSHQNQYTNLNKRITEILTKRSARFLTYGYAPRFEKNWVRKEGLLVPPHLPASEARAFYRFVNNNGLALKPHTMRRKNTGKPLSYGPEVKISNNMRRALESEGSLRPGPAFKFKNVYGPKLPAKTPKRGFEPTLKRLAWNKLPVSRMNNEQLAFLSQVSPINWTLMKPKPFPKPLSQNELTKYRRNLAARVIQRAFKKKK